MENHTATETYDWQSIIDSKESFVDDSFPANINSIYDQKDHSENANLEMYEGIEWKKPSEIYPEGYSILPAEIKPQDICQGKIGDCYFITCLAALANNPKRITKLIKTAEVNESGIYVFSMNVNGTWQDVIVDDSLPCLAGTNTLAFAHANMEDDKGFIWLPLLEKVWAKLNGNYDRIIMGTVDLGFIHLTGVASQGMKHEEMRNDTGKNYLWNKIKKAFENDHIVAAGTQDDAKDMEEALSNGLRANHCYTIVRIYEEKNKTKLLLVRNPWGKNLGTWTGKWSDQDTETWSKSAPSDASIQPTLQDDGLSWMCLEDYLKSFSFTNICQYNDDDVSSYTYMSKENADGMSYFLVDVDKAQKLDFLVNQMGDRLHHRKRNDGQQFEPSWFQLMLCKPSKAQNKIKTPYEYVKSSVSTTYQRHLEIEQEMVQPGQYYLIVEPMWNQCARAKNSQFKSFCVQVLSKTGVKITNCAEPAADTFKSVMISRAIQNKAKSQVLPYKNRKNAYKIVESMSAQSLYGQVVIVNESDQEINETFTFDKLHFFILVGQAAGAIKVTLAVPKNEARTILLRRCGDQKSSFHFNSMMNKTAGSTNTGFALGPTASNPFAGMNLDVPSTNARGRRGVSANSANSAGSGGSRGGMSQGRANSAARGFAQANASSKVKPDVKEKTPAQMITFLENTREIKKVQVIKFEKYFRWEMKYKDNNIYFLFANLGKKTYNLTYEFDMNGYVFEENVEKEGEEEKGEDEGDEGNEEDYIWKIELKPGKKILKKLVECPVFIPEETGPKPGEPGWNPMAGINAKHQPGERYYEYKAKCEIV